jgi:hypothetical protein
MLMPVWPAFAMRLRALTSSPPICTLLPTLLPTEIAWNVEPVSSSPPIVPPNWLPTMR